MDKVYLNSFCTITAGLATNPQEGLFWKRRAELANPFAVTFGSTPFNVFQDLQGLILKNAPLYKRAWVLQESYLSPRTIHFPKFPAFECREMFECESYRTLGLDSAAVNTKWRHHTAKTISRAKDFAYSDWWAIVSNYSRCDLTVASDKLIALSGIAKALSLTIPGGYYAGIWAEWWLQELLWAVDQWLSGDEMVYNRQRGDYRAPSWSWASVDAPIEPWRAEAKFTQTLVELQLISTTPATEDPFGQVSGGEIALKGKLFNLPHFRALAKVERSGLPLYAFSLDDRDNNGFFDNQTFFLPLAKSPDYPSYGDLTICGLLLQVAERDAGQRMAFQRVGYAVVSEVEGNVAHSGHLVQNWTPPAWLEEDLEVVVIV